MRRLKSRSAGWALTGLCLTFGCGEVPRDPEGTLDRVRGNVLVVGATDSPPQITRSGQGANGPEADLIREIAAQLNARVLWRWGPLEEHFAALERFEIDLVAGGLTERTPWRHRVGLTRPWVERADGGGVLAAPPGENRFLVALDSHIVARSRRFEPRGTGGP